MSSLDFERRAVLAGGVLLAASAAPLFAAAPALQPLTYLLPAPREAIVFAPFVLAEAGGRYARAGLAVRFETVAGGANVGRALGQGKGMLGGAVGDTALLLRGEGVPVRGVALLGRCSFLTLMSRRGLALDAASLRGQAIGVPSRRDTSFYALEALLKSVGLSDADITVQEDTPASLIAALSRGALRAIVGTVDWGVKAEQGGAQLEYRALDPFYPALAQAVLAADRLVTEQPEQIRVFVRATLDEIAAMKRNPHTAAQRYLAAVPESEFSVEAASRVFRLLAKHVYGRAPGRFDPERMRAAALAAVRLGLAPAEQDPRDSYTNAFVP